MYLAFERITKDELHDTKISEPYYVGSNLHQSKRGMEQAQVFWVEVNDDPVVGEFYSVNDLPDKLIESQRKFIQLAAESYSRARQPAMNSVISF
jgi:hypothetical protein